jgi:hypothetical protein
LVKGKDKTENLKKKVGNIFYFNLSIMKKLSIANVKQLCRNEMQRIMAESNSGNGGGGICGPNCDPSCTVKCVEGYIYVGRCLSSSGENCFCAGVC